MKFKKILSEFLIILFCTIVFTGCLFSDSATLNKCCELYRDNAEEIIVNNPKDIYSEIQLKIKVDDSDEVDKNYSNLVLIVFNYKQSLKEDLIKSSKYGQLNDDFVDLNKYALMPYCYFQDIFSMETVNNKVDQKYKKELYESIESYYSYINKFIDTKHSLESSYTSGAIDNSNYAKTKLDALVDLNISIIKKAINISECSINAMLNYEGFSETQDSPRDARIGILSTLTYNLKFLINYYEQYIEYNGSCKFSAMPDDFKTLRNNISNLSNIVYNNIVITENSGYSKENTKITLQLLPMLKLTADQTEMLSSKLNGLHYSSDEADSNYNFEQASLEKIYNELFNRSVLNDIYNSVMYI